MSATASVERFPLSWPMGWTRTPYHARKRAAFHSTKTVSYAGSTSTYKQKQSLSVGEGLDRLNNELRRLGARSVIISSNLRVRNDGLPFAQQAKQLDDPGVAVYFQLASHPRVLACDRWLSAAENMAAIAGHIEAIRAQSRYGVGSLDQAFAGYAALPPSPNEWWQVFALPRTATLGQMEERFKELAKTLHPDVGGSHDDMIRLTTARDAARHEFRSTP